MNNGSVIFVPMTSGDIGILNSVLTAVKNNKTVDRYLLQDFEAIVRDCSEMETDIDEDDEDITFLDLLEEE